MNGRGRPRIDRQEIAEALGFSCWESMLSLLYRGCSLLAISDLTGLAIGSLTTDLQKLGVKLRSRGGSNHRGKEYHKKADAILSRRLAA